MDHFHIRIIDESFADLRPLQRQKLILNHFGMDFLLIETSLLIYASTYAILDISDIVLQYIKKNPDKQFLELKK